MKDDENKEYKRRTTINEDEGTLSLRKMDTFFENGENKQNIKVEESS